jgi:UDP-N-acetylglucosamine transferase subunit ALG13
MTALLVANDGGHLMQLHALAPRLPIAKDRLWVTPRTEQSVSLLKDEEVFWVHRAPTRDAAAVARNAFAVRRLLRERTFTSAVSTGSSLALSALPQARLHGIPTYYIESATRVAGPSMSGRILQAVPGIRLICQYPEWTSRNWHYGGSVFDGFEAQQGATARKPPRRIVVSLGTSEKYGFRRLLERMAAILPPNCDVLWQTGFTDTSGLGLRTTPSIPAAEFHRSLSAADVVVAHAGTGIALTALTAGKLPVLVPREGQRGEHVDDHQEQIAHALNERGLAVVRHVEQLCAADLVHAAAHDVHRSAHPPDFRW